MSLDSAREFLHRINQDPVFRRQFRRSNSRLELIDRIELITLLGFEFSDVDLDLARREGSEDMNREVASIADFIICSIGMLAPPAYQNASGNE